ncbi:hypothetical protein NBRC116188_29800 [Oceaniserpentilla sp. 4NH20-0058]|uniref:hypothetical protein n=1 Tax=Oceaniserpentilla sp. 4NH20-0058 TaxID=3127660 RepID=UPI003109344A
MQNRLTNMLISFTILISTHSVGAFELTPEQVNGIYQLAQPERSAAGQTQKLQIEYGQHNGQTVLVAASCPKCPVAGYRLLETETKELGRPVFFNSSGIYVIAYDSNTFISVMADGQLGKKIWEKLVYANVYSKQGTPTIDLEAGKQFVINESKRLMTGEGIAQTKVTGGNGTYYAAAKHGIGSQQYDEMEVLIYPQQKLVLNGLNCRNCTSDTYLYQTELSDAIGKPVYELGHMGRFIIEQDTGILWWTNANLGKQPWGKNSHFNVLAQDKTFARKLTIDKALQSQIDSAFNQYAQQTKAAVDARHKREDQQRTANNQLPKKGLTDQALEQDAFTAAQRWANQYAWKETLKYTYITGNDWSILRHPITGIQTGRRINGVVTMERSDGLCSYQHAVFEQDFNGTDYQKTKMVGVVVGQNKLDCGKL